MSKSDKELKCFATMRESRKRHWLRSWAQLFSRSRNTRRGSTALAQAGSKIADVLDVPVIKLLGLDEEPRATSRGHADAASPLQLLTTPGALRLLRAYARLEDGAMRRS